MRALILACALACVAGTAMAEEPAGDPNEVARLHALIERIAEDRDPAGEAADEVVERIVRPLAAATAPLAERPIEQQMRVQRALGRVHGALRAAIYRIDLPEADRKLFDAVAQRYPSLIDDLFAEEPTRRLAALERIPLDPNSAAGVLIAAKMGDGNLDVIDAAFDKAAALGDAVMARNTARLVREWTALLDSDVPEADDTAYQIVIGNMIVRAAELLAEMDAGGHAAAVREALVVLSRPELRTDTIPLSALILAVGRLGDRAAVPLLEQLLTDQTPTLNTRPVKGRIVHQTIGDAAFLALLDVYDLSPADFGVVGGETPAKAVFTDAEARRAAHRKLEAWQAEHGETTGHEGDGAGEQQP